MEAQGIVSAVLGEAAFITSHVTSPAIAAVYEERVEVETAMEALEVDEDDNDPLVEERNFTAVCEDVEEVQEEESDENGFRENKAEPFKNDTELETNALYLKIQSNVERHEEVLETKYDIEDVKEETEEDRSMYKSYKRAGTWSNIDISRVVRQEVEVEVEVEQEAELEVEVDQELGGKVNKEVNKELDQVVEVEQEVKQKLRLKVEQEVKQEVRQEVKLVEEVEQEVEHELIQEIEEEVIQEVKQEVMQEDIQEAAYPDEVPKSPTEDKVKLLGMKLMMEEMERLLGMMEVEIQQMMIGADLDLVME